MLVAELEIGFELAVLVQNHIVLMVLRNRKSCRYGQASAGRAPRRTSHPR